MKAISDYITKRIETKYNLLGTETAKEYYKSYFNQKEYKKIKQKVDKQLKDKGLDFLIDK